MPAPVEMGAVGSRAGLSGHVFNTSSVVVQPVPSPVRNDGLMTTQHVTWKTQTLPNVEYHGCAIFDTCSFIENPHMLEEVIEQKYLAVIPYFVLPEAEKKKREMPGLRLTMKIFLDAINNTRCKLIDTYLRMEGNWELETKVPGYYLVPKPKNDDFIFKSAVRTKAELLNKFVYEICIASYAVVCNLSLHCPTVALMKIPGWNCADSKWNQV